jgi:hypothetical protein
VNPSWVRLRHQISEMSQRLQLPRQKAITFFQHVAAHLPHRVPVHSPQRIESSPQGQVVDLVQEYSKPSLGEPALRRVRQYQRNRDRVATSHEQTEGALVQCQQEWKHSEGENYHQNNQRHYAEYRKCFPPNGTARTSIGRAIFSRVSARNLKPQESGQLLVEVEMQIFVAVIRTER